MLLQFFASGTFQIICGDGVDVSQSSASRIIRDVSQGLQDIYNQYVRLPNSAEKAEVKTKFYEIAHFPGVLGLVDGTHIRIQRPSENEADYVNRHIYHSINVQLYVDRMVYLVMCWLVFLGLFTIRAFGSFPGLEYMLKTTY